MFDIGFFEVLIIGTLALLVVGPTKLPEAARTVGLWVGKLRRLVQGVQQDIDRQIRMEEMLNRLEKENQKIKSEMHNIEQNISSELSNSILNPDGKKADTTDTQTAVEASEPKASPHESALEKQQHHD